MNADAELLAAMRALALGWLEEAQLGGGPVMVAFVRAALEIIELAESAS